MFNTAILFFENASMGIITQGIEKITCRWDSTLNMVKFLSEVSDFEQHKKNSYQFIESCSKCDSSLLYQTAELFSDSSLYNLNPKMA